MAAELEVAYGTAGATLYAIIRRHSDAKVWDMAGTAWATWADGSIANYDVTLTAKSGDLWQGDFPTSIAAGRYRVLYYVQAGGAPAVTDTLLESRDQQWDGSGLAEGGDVVLSAYALTTLAKLKRYLGISATTWDTILTECINAASDRIERFCRRQFVARAYAEYYHAEDIELIDMTQRRLQTPTARLKLRQWPIVTITRVCQGRQDAIEVKCTATDAGYAWARVGADDTLTLTITGGASAGTTSFDLTGASYDTLAEVVTAVNATSGWSATAYYSPTVNGTYPSASLIPTAGLQCLTPDTAMLEIPDEALSLIEFDSDAGWIELAAPASNLREVLVEYNAGYSTLPDDLDMVCREFSASLFRSRTKDDNVGSESLGDYSYSLADRATFTQSQMERLARWTEIA